MPTAGGIPPPPPPENLFAEKKAEKDANVSRPAQAAYLDGSKFAGRRSSRQFCGLPLATACRIASDARPAGRPPAPDGTPPCPTNRRTRRSGDQSPPAPESGFGNTAANDPVPGRALRCNGPRAGYLLTRCPPLTRRQTCAVGPRAGDACIHCPAAVSMSLAGGGAVAAKQPCQGRFSRPGPTVRRRGTYQRRAGVAAAMFKVLGSKHSW